ncbi:MAG: PQQ-binding-like beta-propeller repeat protein [Planctomycetota bacterium]
MSMPQLRFSVWLVLLTSANTLQADWPQFRGPNGSGIAEEANPPVEFGPDHSLLWRLDVQPGHSSPIVSGNLIFITTYDEASRELSLVAIDRKRGRVSWKRSLTPDEVETGHPSFNPASSTPASDGERVVAYFGSYGLVCFDHQGVPQWEYRLPLTKSYAGNAISPIIAGDKVILYRGNFVDHFLLAVNKHNGKEIWRTPQTEPFHAELACTAVPIVHNDQLILHGARAVQGLELESGKQRWITKCATTATSTPLVVRNQVLVCAWNKMGEPALRPEFPDFQQLLADNDRNQDKAIQQSELPKIWIFHRPEGGEAPQNGATIRFKRVDQDKNGEIDADEWKQQLDDLNRFREGYRSHGLLSLPTNRFGVLKSSDVAVLETQGIPEVPSPISDGRYVYLVKNGGQISCLDLESRERVYRKRTGGSGTHYASPILAAGHLYIADGRGRIVVMAAGESGEIIATNEIGDRVYATPAAVDNCLYVRSHSSLFAFQRKPHSK